MKILWFSWKDMTHPWAGGAELVNERLAKRLVDDGHEVTLLVGGYKGCLAQETMNGYKVIRVGGFYSVFWQAYRYYTKHLRDWPDMVVEEVNTMPFFTKFYAKQPSMLFIHQLCRQVWFYQLKKPWSSIGYLLEPLYLRLLNNKNVITVSESSRQDLMKCGFDQGSITVISEGIDLQPIAIVKPSNKYSKPTLLSLGTVRPMKRTMDQVKAFELAKPHIPDLQLKIAGDISGDYGQTVRDYIAASIYAADIECLGPVTPAHKLDLMRQSHLFMATSIKEGWGLTVTEAASQGTPAVVYDVDGLRDSTHNGQSGLIARHNTPQGLARAMTGVLKDKQAYADLCQRALQSSRQYTFDQCYLDFKVAIGQLPSTDPLPQLVSEEELA